MTQNCINTKNPVLQVVTASTSSVVTLSTALPHDDTIPQNTEGAQVLTVTITPKLSTSLLEISFSTAVFVKGSSTMSFALFQDTTAGALAANGASLLRYGTNGYLKHYMTSGTTSATTFKIRAGPTSGTGYCNANAAGTRVFGGVATTILRVIEFLQ